MDKRTSLLYRQHEETLNGWLAGCFGAEPSELKRLGSFESFVFELPRKDQDLILKLTHTLHRFPEQIEAELDFTDYLHRSGMAVSTPVPGSDGKLMSTRTIDGTIFSAYGFLKSAGRHLRKGEATPAMIRQWGRVLGRMHALTKTYQPATGVARRIEWHQDPYMAFEDYIPAEQTVVLDRGHNLMDRMTALPKDRESYGLVHTDLHNWNFLVDQERIVVLDFDDCCFHWFAYDLSIPLFYALRDDTVGENAPAFARHFMQHFLKGYEQENYLDPSWLRYLPMFLKLREFELYTVIYTEGNQDHGPWVKSFMDGRRESIEEGTPIIDVDFTTLV